MNATQTPQQEFQERAAEQASAWLTVPHLVALQNLRELWANAQQRVKDSHAAQMKTIGGEATDAEMPGDIGISGDHTTTIHHHYPAPPSMIPAILNKMAPYVLCAALGSAGPLAYLWWTHKPTEATQPIGKDWQIGVEVKDQP